MDGRRRNVKPVEVAAAAHRFAGNTEVTVSVETLAQLSGAVTSLLEYVEKHPCKTNPVHRAQRYAVMMRAREMQEKIDLLAANAGLSHGDWARSVGCCNEDASSLQLVVLPIKGANG